MYYLRIEGNKFSFLIEGISNITNTDIKISNEDYMSFLEQQSNGKQFRLKAKPTGNSLFDYIESFETEYEKLPKSKLDLVIEENVKLKQQQAEQDEMIIENAFIIANLELGGVINV